MIRVLAPGAGKKRESKGTDSGATSALRPRPLNRTGRAGARSLAPSPVARLGEPRPCEATESGSCEPSPASGPQRGKCGGRSLAAHWSRPGGVATAQTRPHPPRGRVSLAPARGIIHRGRGPGLFTRRHWLDLNRPDWGGTRRAGALPDSFGEATARAPCTATALGPCRSGYPRPMRAAGGRQAEASARYVIKH